MPPQDNQTNKGKYTRGEKCLFIHVLITFGLILLLLTIFIIHLCVVSHARHDIWRIYRRAYERSISGLTTSEYESIGAVYLNITPARLICNTLLLREHWSLAPAQCTSMREDPDMSKYLFQWRILYKVNGKQIESSIKRSLSHSRFNRGDYTNNIGLFEHLDPIYVDKYYVAPTNFQINDEIFQKYSSRMVIIDWEIGITEKGDISQAITNRVRPIPLAKCKMYAVPIVEKLRDYEFCVTFDINGPVVDHGALFVVDAKIIGFFSWGDIKARGVPLMILNILHFREWFESIVHF